MVRRRDPEEGAVGSPATGARRGRPPQLSADDIVAAATGLLDSDWTIASLSRELGVSDAAIYYYFANKKAIQHAVAMRIFASQPFADPGGDWRALLTATARHWYSLYVRYPAFLELEAWRGMDYTGGFDTLEHGLAVMVRAGFTAPESLILVDTIWAIARGFASHAALDRDHPASPNAITTEPERFPTLIAAAATLPQDVGLLLERALDFVLDGAAASLKAKDV